MLQSFGQAFSGLATFSGRTAPGRFWPYASLIVVATFGAIVLCILPGFIQTFERMQRFAAEHPDQATVTRSAGSYSISIEGNHPELLPDIGGMVTGIGAVMAVAVILLAAIVARRLHDGGRSAFWGLLPLPFLTIGLVGFMHLFARFASADPPIPLFLALFANNMAYIGSLLLLILFLIRPSDPAANRYGEPPAS